MLGNTPAAAAAGARQALRGRACSRGFACTGKRSSVSEKETPGTRILPLWGLSSVGELLLGWTYAAQHHREHLDA